MQKIRDILIDTNSTMSTDLMPRQKDHQDPIKAYGKSMGEGLHCFAGRRLYCPVLCLKLPFTDSRDLESIEITFPITSFPEKKDPVLFVIKANVIFSCKRKGIRFSSCFKSIHRFIAEMTGTGCINRMTPAE